MDLISNGIEKASVAEHYARKRQKVPISIHFHLISLNYEE
jgi:hypothetical protein